MAIQVSGTQVIGNSRELTNITSVDTTTKNSIIAAGVGDIQGVTAGSGISGGGTSGTVTISHADTSSQGSINNSGNTVIQDISVDTYGHITSMSSATISTSPPNTYNAVGSYTTAMYPTPGTSQSAGFTTAGSNLKQAYFATYTKVDPLQDNATNNHTFQSINASGTWRLMNNQISGSTAFADWHTGALWIRIS